MVKYKSKKTKVSRYRTRTKRNTKTRKSKYAKRAYKTFSRRYKYFKPYIRPKVIYRYRNKPNYLRDYLKDRTDKYYANLMQFGASHPTMVAALSGITRRDSDDDLTFSDDEAVRKAPRTALEQNALNAMMRATDAEYATRAMEARNERESLWDVPGMAGDATMLNESTMTEYDAM